MKRWLLVAMTVAAMPMILAESCGGGTGGTPPGGGNSGAAGSPSQRIVAVGTPMVSSTGKTVTVTAFKRNYSSGNSFEVPAAGKECVQVTFVLVNGSKTEWTLPTFELNVLDSNGQKYDISFICGQSDDISSLVAGGHATVNEVYEVPAGIALDATWKPNIFLDAVFQTTLK
jgi:hypothetical protein